MISTLTSGFKNFFGLSQDHVETVSVRKRRSILPIRTPPSKKQRLTFTNIQPTKACFEKTLLAFETSQQIEALPFQVQRCLSDLISFECLPESPKIHYKALVQCETPQRRSSPRLKNVKTIRVIKSPRPVRKLHKNLLEVVQAYTRVPLNATPKVRKEKEMNCSTRQAIKKSTHKRTNGVQVSSKKYPFSRSLPDPEPIVLDSSDNEVETQAIANTGELRNLRVSPEQDHEILSHDFLKRNGALNQYAELIERYKNQQFEIRKSTARYQKFCTDHITKKIECLSREPPLTRVRFPDKEPEYPELNDDMQREIDFILGPGDPNEELVKAFAIPIKRRDIRTLIGLEWLNDEIINFYLNLIADRSQNDNNLPKCHIMNTFFYPRLLEKGFSGVSRWTRRIDLFSFDYVLIPIHLRVHWCLAWIDISQKTITYFDSMGAPNDQCLHALANYLPSEHMDKKKSELSMDEWGISNASDIPHQRNASDCGVFAMTFAEHISSRKPFKFSQRQMPYFRRKMAYEIVNQALLE